MRIALLGKNIGIYSLGNVALRAAAFLLIPIYTRFLSVESYGLLDICTITMQILIIFMGLGMPQSLVRFYREHEIIKETGKLFTSSLTINLIGCLALVALILPVRTPLSRMIFGQDYSSILLLVCFISVGRSVTQSSLSYFRAKNQALVYSAIALVIMVGLMAFNIYFVILLKKGIPGILYSYLIVYGLAAIVISAFIIWKDKPIISLGLSKKLLVFGLPLIFSMSGWFIIQMSSRYFLANYSGLTEVGIYGLGYRIVTILQIVIVMPFQLAFGPFIFSQEKDPELKTKISTILTYLLTLLLTTTWLTGFLAKIILKIMAPSEYQEAHMVVLLILPSVIAIGVYYWAASLLHLKNKTQWIGVFIASSAIINIFLNLWLIPKYGWYGAAIATNASIILAMVLNFLFSQKFYRVSFEKHRLYRLFSAFLILCGILVITLRLNNLAYYCVNGGAFILIAFLLYNSKFLKREKNSVKKASMSELIESKRPGLIPLDSISTKLTKQNLLIFLLISIGVGALSATSPIIAAFAIPVLIAIPLTLFFPYEVFLFLAFLLLALGDYAGSKPILLGGFKFYGADYFLVILIIVIIKASREDRTKLKSPLTLLLLIYIAYGVISLLFGLLYQNHELNRTIGDFRRFFYYPVAFFLGWNIISEKKSILKLEKITTFIPFIIMAFASFRLATGRTWAPEIHAKPEDFRAMPYFDGITLIFIFSYLVTLFLTRKKLSLLQMVFAFLIPIFIVLSGFRLLWGLFILSVLLVLWFTFRQKGKRNYIRVLLYLILILLVSLTLFRMAGGKYYDMFEAKIVDRILRYEHSSERWRYPAWKSAIEKFQDSPIVGTGLGDEPTFWAVNSAGQWAKITRTLHNAFLEILYQTGIIGGLLFLLFLAVYSIVVYKNIPLVERDIKPILVALFVLFICGFIQSLFQPYLNHPGNGVLFFAFMGISIKTIYLSNWENKNR